jgi:hypothetical protein
MSYHEQRTIWPLGYTAGDRARYREKDVSILSYQSDLKILRGHVPIAYIKVPYCPFFVPADDLEWVRRPKMSGY